MKRFGLYIIALGVVLFLGAYTCTYTIRFTEKGVLTLFGRALSIKDEPGLGFKWPHPVQSVTTYDTRPRVTRVKLETMGTRDSSQIVVESYCIWRVSDPLKFFETFNNSGSRAQEHFEAANDTVESNLRSAMGAVSKFEMKQLFNDDPKIDGLSELEKDVLGQLASDSKAEGAQKTLADVGIKVVDVGISQVVLPQETTNKVFERMGANRDRIASNITSKAEAEGRGIRERAENDAKRIEYFAKQLAAEIIRKGDEEAKQYYDMMKENPNLAVFLVETEFIRSGIGRPGTTLVLPWSLPGFRVLKPGAAADILKNGAITAPDTKLDVAPAKSAQATKEGER